MALTEERKNLYPNPPPLMTIEDMEDVQSFADNVQRHLSALALYTQYRQTSLLDVLNDDIVSMSISKLTAGTINVDSIFVGDDIELDGLLSQIRVLDDTPNVRVNIGRFGAGTDAGARFYDATGTLRMEFADTTFIDGVVISDGTIEAVALNVSQLSAITADMGALTAGSITGGLIRTSASSPRVELTTTGIAGYDSGGVVIFDLTTSGTVRFGKSAGNNILWDSAAGVIVVTGDIIATGNIQTSAVVADLVASNAITTIKLNALSVTNPKVGASAIDENKRITVYNQSVSNSGTGAGRSNHVFTHNLGRKVIVTPWLSAFSVSDPLTIAVSLVTTNSFQCEVWREDTGSWSYTLQVDYW